jgi:hypothetical protein
MAEFPNLSMDARQALSDLILQSLPSWDEGLRALSLIKRWGHSSRLFVISPLKHFLQTTPWMAIREAKGVKWAQPADRWYVPADVLAGRSRHYAHLRALPAGLAQYIGEREKLAVALRDLGLQFFDPHSTTESSRLLEALTTAVGSDEVSDSNVLLGQIRDAWQRFRPASNQPPLTQLAVRRQDRRLSALTPTVESPAYLPDLATYVTELENLGLPVIAMATSDARELRNWFTSVYEDRIQLTSALSVVPHVDGTAWTGSSAVALADSELGWLIRPLLVMVAAQGRGVHTPAFKDRVETLHTARLDWVPNLSVAVMRSETRLVTATTAALWEPDSRTLIVTERCRTRPGELSAAFAQALERDDFEFQLRFLLNTVTSIESAPDDIAAFLAPLRVQPEQVHQILEHLRGDVGQMSRFLCVLCRVLKQEADLSELQAAASEDDIITALNALALPGLDISNVLRKARDSQDLSDFGRVASRSFGEAATLARWNSELAARGESQLMNRNWQSEFQAQIEEAAALFKRLAAHMIRLGAQHTYPELWKQYCGLIDTVDLSRSHWIVSFNDVMQLVANLIATWSNDHALLLGVRGACSVQDLRQALTATSVQVDLDPDECGRTNHELVDTVARALDRLRLATWVRISTRVPESDWHALADDYRRTAAAELTKDAFSRMWTEAEVFAMVKRGVPDLLIPEFQAALDASSDLASLQSALNLSTEELAHTDSRLAALNTERARRRAFVKVCDDDFDSSEENLDQLWSFLTTRVTEAHLAKQIALDLEKPIALGTFKPKARGNNAGPGSPPKRPQRQSKAVDALVGLAGEIYVYRMLRQEYGEDAVSSSAWISENSQRAFPFNEADDSMGCDFAFTAKGKQFRVEVKSSTGDDESFTLGSSEIRLAMEIATKKKRRRIVFVLVHVRNALSAQPTAVVLPNPYDSRNADRFKVEEAGARVRYHFQEAQ